MPVKPEFSYRLCHTRPIIHLMFGLLIHIMPGSLIQVMSGLLIHVIPGSTGYPLSFKVINNHRWGVLLLGLNVSRGWFFLDRFKCWLDSEIPDQVTCPEISWQNINVKCKTYLGQWSTLKELKRGGRIIFPWKKRWRCVIPDLIMSSPTWSGISLRPDRGSINLIKSPKRIYK